MEFYSSSLKAEGETVKLVGTQHDAKSADSHGCHSLSASASASAPFASSWPAALEVRIR